MKAWSALLSILLSLAGYNSSVAEEVYQEDEYCYKLDRLAAKDSCSDQSESKRSWKTGQYSNSCWSGPKEGMLKADDPKSASRIIGLSQETLKGLINLIHTDIEIDEGRAKGRRCFDRKPRESLERVKSALEAALSKSDGRTGAAFFVQPSEMTPGQTGVNRIQTECDFYSRRGNGVVDLGKVVARFSLQGGNCTQASEDLADIVSRGRDLAYHRILDPLDIVYLKRLPDETVSAAIASASPSLTLLLRSSFGLYQDSEHGLPFAFDTVAVPALRYKTGDSESLLGISKALLGSEDSWQALWTINAAQVHNPFAVQSGLELIVPLKPGANANEWVEFDASKMSDLEIAEKLYHSKDYAKFVEILRSKQSELVGGGGGSFRVPILTELETANPIEIDVIRYVRE